MNFWQQLPRPFFVLAPMDDVTDVVFRQFVGEVSPPDVFFTEFVAVDAFGTNGHVSALERLRLPQVQVAPTIAQIWGNDPEKFYLAARLIADMEFAGIDINMGCPEKSVVKRGSGGGLIGQHEPAGAIIAAVKAGAPSLPVSVKTRLGLRSNTIDDWAMFLLHQNLAALTIHGRTVKEMSKVPAHWDQIARVREIRDSVAPHTAIIGNGDVAHRFHGLERAAETGVDGIMIGRGIFHDINAFSLDRPELVDELHQVNLLLKHLELYQSLGSTKPYHTMKKFIKVYIANWSNAGSLRSTLMETKTPDEAREVLKLYTSSLVPKSSI